MPGSGRGAPFPGRGPGLSAAETDRRQILALCDQLAELAPGPIVSLNRAVAVSEVDGPAFALAIVDDLRLERYHLSHAIRADLLCRLGRDQFTEPRDRMFHRAAESRAAANGPVV